MEIKDYATLTISAAALVLSIYNLRRAAKLRQDTIAREEFNDTVREPITRALSDISSKIPLLRNLTRSCQGLDKIKSDLNDIAKSIWESTELLNEALAEADCAEWVVTKGWGDAASVELDKFLQATQTAGENKTSFPLLCTHVAAAEASLVAVKKLMRERIRSEVKMQLNK